MATVTLVCGPPGSGKTRYVRERWRRGDLVLDLDALKSALSMCPFHAAPDAVAPYAIAARDAVLMALHRPGGVAVAWVIACMPTAGERGRLARSLNAKVVVLEVQAEECIRRIMKDPTRQGLPTSTDWRRIVEAWWRDYETSDRDTRLPSGVDPWLVARPPRDLSEVESV